MKYRLLWEVIVKPKRDRILSAYSKNIIGVFSRTCHYIRLNLDASEITHMYERSWWKCLKGRKRVLSQKLFATNHSANFQKNARDTLKIILNDICFYFVITQSWIWGNNNEAFRPICTESVKVFNLPFWIKLISILKMYTFKY